MITEFDKFNNLQKATNEQLQLILDLITEFVEYNNDFKKAHDIKDTNDRDTFKAHSYEDFGNTIEVWYEYDKFMKGAITKVMFTPEEYKKLLDFMEKPDMYRSTKKYNL